jgi:hypothetical protein
MPDVKHSLGARGKLGGGGGKEEVLQKQLLGSDPIPRITHSFSLSYYIHRHWALLYQKSRVRSLPFTHNNNGTAQEWYMALTTWELSGTVNLSPKLHLLHYLPDTLSPEYTTKCTLNVIYDKPTAVCWDSNSVALVRERIIPTKRPPLVGGSPTAVISVSRPDFTRTPAQSTSLDHSHEALH